MHACVVQRDEGLCQRDKTRTFCPKITHCSLLLLFALLYKYPNSVQVI